MKSCLLIPLCVFWVISVSAQLTITSGAVFSVNGDMPLSLENCDLVNNGILNTQLNTTTFTGNASSSIRGSGVIRFFRLEVNKSGNQSLVLEKSINVTGSIVFSTGFLDLNGFNIDLETTGQIEGEKNTQRITGANGGQVLLRTSLNAPSNINPGNLGVQLTSDQDLGQVTIKRGHKSQAVNSSPGISVLRYYDISSANNTDLNASIRFNYFDGELNGLNEGSLVFFQSDDAVNWSALGFASRDISANVIERTGIPAFSRFTLSVFDEPLPVLFTSFNAKCEGSKVLITWKTGQEENSSHFNIEKSTDGVRWIVIGTVPAAGSSSTERSYSFEDNNPDQNAYYRIAQYDLDGKVAYTDTVRSSCATTDIFRLWPNPVQDKVFLSIVTPIESQVMINIFDSKGALVKVQEATALPGNNQFNIDMRSLAKGIYQLSVSWKNRQYQKTLQVMKE